GANGIVDMTSSLATQLRDQVIGSLTLETGAAANSNAQVKVGFSARALNGNVAMQAVGQSNLSGASITGDTTGQLALNTYNSATGLTRVFRVDDTGNSSF